MMSGRSPAIAIAVIVCAILIWLTGCQPELSSYQTDSVMKACTDHGGRVLSVTPTYIQCDYPKKDAQ